MTKIELIEELKKISKNKETPYLPMDGNKKSFEKGWYLAINRILNSLERESEEDLNHRSPKTG